MERFIRFDVRVAILALLLLSVTLSEAATKVATLPMTFDLQLVDGQYIPFQNGRPMISFDPQERPTLNLAGTWKKQRFAVDHDFSLGERTPQWFDEVNAESEGAIDPGYNDSGWEEHHLPGVENVMPATPEDPIGPEIYENGLYYRRHIPVPAAWQDSVVRLVVLAAEYVTDVWINGTWVGYHEGGYGSFALDVSTALLYGQDNVIVIRIDAVPWGLRMDILPNLFATDWMHYVGVIQELYLEAAPAAHVVRADVLPQNAVGDLSVSVVVENRGATLENLTAEISAFNLDQNNPEYLHNPIAAQLIDAPAALSGSTEKTFSLAHNGYLLLDFSVRLENVALWTPEQPNLYALQVVLSLASKASDTFTTQFGVRTVQVGAGAKVLLNNRPVFFTGMARHEDWPDSGRTATMEKIAADLQIIRDTQVWFIRTAHYPNHPYTYLLTDRMGFAVWEEIPAWWINYISIPILMQRGLAKQMWREMIWNGRNRPSILFWSLCNEPMWYFVYNLRDYVRDLHEDLDENFPDGRLVTQSLAADGAVLTGDAQQDVDVAGWTMYFGVFYGEDIVAESQAFLQRQHERFPDIPLLVCEYGYWSNDDGSGEARQVEVANQSLDAFYQFAAVDPAGLTQDGPLCAVIWWCQFNWYRIEEGHNQTMGLMHMDRETDKPVHQTVMDRYQPYFEMGGLGEPTSDDDAADDDITDDDEAGNDDGADDDSTPRQNGDVRTDDDHDHHGDDHGCL